LWPIAIPDNLDHNAGPWDSPFIGKWAEFATFCISIGFKKTLEKGAKLLFGRDLRFFENL